MREKREVLILCQFFYPEHVSSATLPKEMAEDMVDAGLGVDVLCGYPTEYYDGEKKLPEKDMYKGINITRVRYLQLDRINKVGRLINYFSFVASIAIRWPKLLRYKCLIVYSTPPLLPLIPALASKFFGKRFVFVAYDVYPDMAVLLKSIRKGSIIEKIMNLTNKIVYKEAEKVVALGHEMKQYMLKKALVKNQEKVEVIPNWYDQGKITVSSEIRNKDIADLRKPGKFIVLYSGNMGICQDMKTIMDCILLLKKKENMLFIFTGHGNKVEEMKQIVEDNRLKNVRFYGFLLGSDYSDMLKIADVYLVSLERGIEGMGVPSKTYSYLAAGRPVLAIMSDDTDVSRDLRTYSAGYSFRQGDVEGLAQAIENMAADHHACEAMGNNARQMFIENYDRSICTNKYITLVRNIIGQF